jgi:RND family efflux transporter MFP subunit
VSRLNPAEPTRRGRALPRASASTTRALALAWALAAPAGIAASAEPPTAPTADAVVLRHCDIAYKRTSMVGVAHMGTTNATVLQDCYVRQGDRVKAGQVLGRVMDQDVRAELELRKAEAANDIDVRLGEARTAGAGYRLKRSQALQQRAFLSAEEVNTHELDAVTARLQVEQSKFRLQLAALERRQAEVMLRAREFVAPHDGIVVEVRKERGEAVTMADPVFQVVDVDTLKVSGFLNLGDFWRVKEGQPVRVWAEVDGDDLPIEREVFPGAIVFVDRRIDPVTRTCRVIAEVPNRDLLLASGLEARMEISFVTTPAPVGDAASPNAPAAATAAAVGPPRLADQRPTSPHP